MPEDKPMWFHKGKGDRGEEIVKDILRSKNVIFHENDQCNSHVVDFFCQSGNGGPKYYFMEVKTKNYFSFQGEEAGFQTEYLEKYLDLITHPPTDIFLTFVDPKKKEIYGNWLSKLLPHLRKEQLEDRMTWGKPEKKFNDAVMFPLSKMKKLATLTEEQLEYINGNQDSRAASSQITSTI